MKSLELVTSELKSLFPDESKQKILHIWGNHEFYNFARNEIIHLPINTAKRLNQNLDLDINKKRKAVINKITYNIRI